MNLRTSHGKLNNMLRMTKGDKNIKITIQKSLPVEFPDACKPYSIKYKKSKTRIETTSAGM